MAAGFFSGCVFVRAGFSLVILLRCVALRCVRYAVRCAVRAMCGALVADDRGGVVGIILSFWFFHGWVVVFF